VRLKLRSNEKESLREGKDEEAEKTAFPYMLEDLLKEKTGIRNLLIYWLPPSHRQTSK